MFLAGQLGIGVDSSNGPQKMHQNLTARLGGMGIFVAFLLGCLIFYDKQMFFILSGLFLVFLSGFLEDLLGTLKPALRLLIQILGVVLVLQSGLGWIDNLEPLVTLPFFLAVGFSIFGIVGVCNAMNIIDGLNGLAGGIGLIVLGSIAFASKSLGVEMVFELSVFALCGIFGFLLLNFPFGKIFLGDGGAYFLGALIGFLLGMLSNEGMSAYFGLSVMIYPVWEVVFSIFRRKLRGKKAMYPDGLHLHSLVHQILKNNPLSTLVILCVYAIYIFCVLNLASSANDFILASGFFVLFYVVVYALLYCYINDDRLKRGNIGMD